MTRITDLTTGAAPSDVKSLLETYEAAERALWGVFSLGPRHGCSVHSLLDKRDCATWWIDPSGQELTWEDGAGEEWSNVARDLLITKGYAMAICRSDFGDEVAYILDVSRREVV